MTLPNPSFGRGKKCCVPTQGHTYCVPTQGKKCCVPAVGFLKLYFLSPHGGSGALGGQIDDSVVSFCHDDVQLVLVAYRVVQVGCDSQADLLPLFTERAFILRDLHISGAWLTRMRGV